ncbi:MAG: PTS mannose/fructose/sorbose/N-acetylgalactosamine transporter subunit IIC [Spirochaetia bacterium]
MFMPAFLIALFVMIASIDWLVGNFGLNYGVIIGLVVGLVLGDPLKGLMYGGFFELVFLGMLGAGGAQPPNKIVGTALGTAFAILTKQDPGTAISIAFPAAVLMQAILIFIFTINSNNVPVVEKAALKGDWKAVEWHTWKGTLIMGFGFFLVTFIAIFFGSSFVETIVNYMPKWLTDGFGIAGRMLPAAGFAVVLNYFLKWKNSYYLIFGFCLVAYFNLPPLGLALMALCIALIEFGIRNDGTEKMETIPKVVTDVDPDQDGL